MPRPRTSESFASIFVALTVLACSDFPEAQLVIRTGLEDRPFDGATELRVALEQGSETLMAETYPITEREAALGTFPVGLDFRFRVDVIGGTQELARGRSFPFDVDGETQRLRVSALVGSIGRFVRSTREPLSGTAVAALPAADGALIATEQGQIVKYRVHPEPNELALTLIDEDPELAGAQWATTGDNRYLVAVSGARIVAFDSGGLRSAEANAVELLAHTEGTATVALPGTPEFALVGGADSGGNERADVTIVSVTAVGIAVRSSRALPSARRDVRVATVTVREGTMIGTRIVAVGGRAGGNPVTYVTALDTAGLFGPTEIELPALTVSPSISAISSGVILIAGGTADTAGPPSPTLTLVQVQQDSISELASPPRLTQARTGAAIVPIADGVVIVAGGVGLDGSGLVSVELVDVSLDNFPGDVVFTGNLLNPTEAPVATRLGDGTVAVFGNAGVSTYIPPR